MGSIQMAMKTWYYATPNNERFDTTESELPNLVAAGTITPQTRVWSSGMSNWTPAGQVLPQLFGGDGAPPADAPPAQLPPHQQQPQPQAQVQSQPQPQPGAGAGAVQSHEVDYEIFGDDMQIVEVELDPGESVIAEAGAMNYVEPDITFEAKMGDGSDPGEGMMGKLLSVGKRALTGESIFMTHFQHAGSSGKRRAAFAAPYPGKVLPMDLSELGGELTCQKDSFLCAAFGTKVSIAFNRRLGSGAFGGEGFILQKLTGNGNAFVHAGGTVTERQLNGETLRVDTGCLVAFTSGIDYNIERAGNLKSMFFGGEGLFLATLSGHGKVWLQSLPLSRLADRIIQFAPSSGGKSKGEGSVLGGFGRMLDGS